MRKVHTRTKRHYKLRTHQSQQEFFHPQEKPHRPKTFKSEEAAHKWAVGLNLNKDQYQLASVKNNKRFAVVVNNGKN